jgi:hypothetical protein
LGLQLIRRSAKMLAENVDCPGQVSKKDLALRKTALESTLPPHNDGVARRVSERIESCFRAQSEFPGAAWLKGRNSQGGREDKISLQERKIYLTLTGLLMEGSEFKHLVRQ